MNKEVERIIMKECNEIHRALLLELCQMDSRNEDRILELYNKY